MSERRNLTPEEWARIEAELVSEIEREMRSLAQRLAARLMERMRQEASGQHVYIARAPRYDEEAVLADFDGRNYREVCAKHSISVATFYRILDRSRAVP